MNLKSPRILALLALTLTCSIALTGCDKGDSADTSTAAPSADKPTVAFVTNGIATFWDIAKAGALAAGKDFDVNVEVKFPANGIVDQNRIIEDLITLGIDGIAISAIDPNNQAQLLNNAAEKTFLITHDSDAPNIDRLCYIGMDNYLAGWMCGELVREAMPDGGELAIFIGRLEQDNAKKRRQGMIDAVLQRSKDDTRYDAPADGPVSGGGFTIVDTRTDQFDRAKAKANAEDLLIKYPNLAGMVGLFAYNTPLCLDAVKAAGKADQVAVIAFDEPDEVLQAITTGEIHGTVVQNPYEYGYQSVRVLAALARGDESLIPENKFINIIARSIVKDNVTEFWDDLKAKIAAGSE